MGLLNEIDSVVHSDCVLLDYIPEDYESLNNKVGAYKTIRCDWYKCQHVIHASNNENMVEWIETAEGNYCTECFLRKHGKKPKVTWVDVITGKPVESMANCDEDGWHITRRKERFCACRAKLEPRKRYCDKCRRKRRRDSYRKHRGK